MPRRFDLLPSCLLLAVFIFGSWSSIPWLIGGGVLAVVAFVAEQGRRRRRDGALAHQRYAMSGSLGWGFAGVFLALAAVTFWLPVLIEGTVEPVPTWLRAVVAVLLGLGLWQAAQSWLRARARRVGSSEGAWGGSPEAGGSIAELISRTQTVRVDALVEDLAMPLEELGPRLDALRGAGVLERSGHRSGPTRGDDWVHLTFRGEQSLSERSAPTQAAQTRRPEASEQR